MRLGWERFNRDGVRAAAENLYAPDVVFVDLPDLPGGGEHHGIEATIVHLEGFFESWSNPRVDLREILEEGDRMSARFVLSASGRSSGLSTELEQWHVYTFRGDLVARVEAYMDADQAAAALRG